MEYLSAASLAILIINASYVQTKLGLTFYTYSTPTTPKHQ